MCRLVINKVEIEPLGGVQAMARQAYGGSWHSAFVLFASFHTLCLLLALHQHGTTHVAITRLLALLLLCAGLS